MQTLYEKTMALHGHITQGMPKEEREIYIEKLNLLLDERDALIKLLSGTYTDEEMKLGQKIVMLNKQFEPLLKEQLKMIEADIGTFKRKKAGRNKYLKGYQQVSKDGMFLDKKK